MGRNLLTGEQDTVGVFMGRNLLSQEQDTVGFLWVEIYYPRNRTL